MKLTIEQKIWSCVIPIIIILIYLATCSCSSTKTIVWCDYNYIYFEDSKTPNKTHELYFVGDEFKMY